MLSQHLRVVFLDQLFGHLVGLFLHDLVQQFTLVSLQLVQSVFLYGKLVLVVVFEKVAQEVRSLGDGRVGREGKGAINWRCRKRYQFKITGTEKVRFQTKRANLQDEEGDYIEDEGDQSFVSKSLHIVEVDGGDENCVNN